MSFHAVICLTHSWRNLFILEIVGFAFLCCHFFNIFLANSIHFVDGGLSVSKWSFMPRIFEEISSFWIWWVCVSKWSFARLSFTNKNLSILEPVGVEFASRNLFNTSLKHLCIFEMVSFAFPIGYLSNSFLREPSIFGAIRR